MKPLICPFCGGKFRIEEATTEAIFLAYGQLQGKFDRHWPAVDEYIDCFAQSAQGTVSFKQRVRRAAELLKLFETQEFEFQGKRYRTTRQEIITAMLEICNAGKWGFNNHNYLKKILLKTAERVSAEGMTAAEEKGKEEEKRVGSRQYGVSTKDEIGLEEAIKRHPSLKQALDKFGKEK